MEKPVPGKPTVPVPKHVADPGVHHGHTTIYTKEHVKKYVGKWIHVHSTYGMHAGICHRALHDGIVLVHHCALASGEGMTPGDLAAEPHTVSDDGDFQQVQFLLPAPGLFIPYGGLFGIWPRPGFII